MWKRDTNNQRNKNKDKENAHSEIIPEQYKHANIQNEFNTTGKFNSHKHAIKTKERKNKTENLLKEEKQLIGP